MKNMSYLTSGNKKASPQQPAIMQIFEASFQQDFTPHAHEVETPADTTTAETIEVDLPYEGTWEFANDADWIRFEVEAGTSYIARVTGLNGLGNASTGLRLVDELGRTVRFENSLVHSPASPVEMYFEFLVSGTYFISVESLSLAQVGDYQLDIRTEVSQNSSYAAPVGLGTTYSEIDFFADVDVFRFPVLNGRTYEVLANTTGGSPWADVEFYILDAHTQFVTSSTTLLGSTDSQASFTASSTGDYFIGLTSFTTFEGEYFFTIGDAGSIDGTSSDDSLTGRPEDDMISGLAGNDMIQGGDGNYTILGGAGFDTLNGNGGDDLIEGGAQADLLDGGAGDDILLGQDGLDNLYGGGGDDRVNGDAGNDRLFGGAGGDTMRGGINEDRIFGEDGDDLLYGDAGFDRVEGCAGNDTLFGGAQADNLYGGIGDD